MIEIRNLKKYYVSGIFKKTVTKAVNGVDLSIPKGMVYGLTGESGCGKTTLAMSVLRLIEPTSGSITINGRDFRKLKGWELRRLRPKYQIIWQNPEASLNPRMKLKDAIMEPLRYFKKCGRDRQKDILEKYCKMVELPTELLNRYPHEISGGESQRAVIARILTMEPELLIADEPTSSLDILVQAQILGLLKTIQEQLNISLIYISHDLQVVRYMCDRVAVMFEGKIIEEGTCEDVLRAPKKRYSRELVENTFGEWGSQNDVP